MRSEKEYREQIRQLEAQIKDLSNQLALRKDDLPPPLHFYHTIFDEAPFGCAINEIIYDEKNHPIDFKILDFNQAFEHAAKVENKKLKGQKASQCLTQMDEKWFAKFALVVQSGKRKHYTEFSLDGEKFFDIEIHSPQQKIFILSLVSEQKKLRPIMGPVRFYERLMDHLHEGIWVTNEDDVIFFTNSGITLNTGSQKDSLLGKNIHDFQKKNLGDFLKDYLAAKRTLEPRQYETHLQTLSGDDAFLAGWLVPLIKNHRFDGMICTTRNITEEKQSRQRVWESEEKLRNIIEHSSNVFYSHTPDNLLTYVSPQMENLLGYTSEEAKINWTILTSDNPINKKGIESTIKAIKTGQVQQPYELELMHKNGKRVWVEVREAPVVTNGITTSIVGALIDITEQKEIAQQLTENQRGLRNLIDESPIPIAINSLGGDIEYLNQEFVNTFGYTNDEIPHVEDWFKIAYPDSTYRQHIKTRWFEEVKRSQQDGHKRTPFEARITCKDGTPLFVQIVWSEIGEKLVLIFHNLTEHKELEDKIMQKNDELQNAMNELQKANQELQIATQKARESDQLKSAFLANMSHEIRTPMNSIIGFSSLLAQPAISEEKRMQYTEFIQKSGTHLLRIIDDIIDIAKIESNQLKIEKSYFSVVPFLQNTLDYHLQSALLSFKPHLKLLLHHELVTKPIIIFTDPIRLKQVFDNLLTNSIKNTDDGQIEFGVHQLDEHEITFFVSDTGVGIPEKYKQSIFKRFTQIESQTVKHGTGLGLSIIQGITNLLDGKIWFDSKENIGTTFYVQFPILPKEH